MNKKIRKIWVENNTKILSYMVGVFMVMMTVLGYFLDRTIDQSDQRNREQITLIEAERKERIALIETERKERIQEDKEIRLIIDNKIGLREFNEFKGQILLMREDTKVIKDYIFDNKKGDL